MFYLYLYYYFSCSIELDKAQENESAAALLTKKKAQRKYEIVELKYSPTGDVIALGCKDNLIHLLRIHGDHELVGNTVSFKHLSICRGHSSCIRNLDFSVDGKILQSTDGARELFHWDVATGARLLNPSDYRNVEWASFTCLYGWHVQGIFNCREGQQSLDADVNCVSRCPDGSIIAVGTSQTVQNAIKLFDFPCLPKAIPSVHGGHTSPVLDVAFVLSGDSDRGLYELLSSGGNDSCVFQWTVIK